MSCRRPDASGPSSSSPTPRADRSPPRYAHPGCSGAWTRLAGVWTPLAVAVMVASLGLGAWCLASGARGRYLNQSQYTGLLALSAVVLVQSLVAVVRLIAGDRPADLATFIGYLLTTALFLPAGVSLARME